MQTALIKTKRKYYLETADNLRDLCKIPMRLSVDKLIRFVPQFEYLEKMKLFSLDMKNFVYNKGIPVFYMENKEVIYMDEIRWNDGTYKFFLNRDLSIGITDSLTLYVYRPVFASLYDMTPIGAVLEERF